MNRFITWWSDCCGSNDRHIQFAGDAVRNDEFASLENLYDEKLARSKSIIDYWVNKSQDYIKTIEELREENERLKLSIVDEDSIFNDAFDKLKAEISASVYEFNAVSKCNVEQIGVQYISDEAIGFQPENILTGVHIYAGSNSGYVKKLERK